MKLKTNIVIAALVSFAVSYGFYYGLPLLSEDVSYGATITTINGSDTLSSSRTTINNNFSALNAGKIENSTTSLPLITSLAGLTTIGTISTGVWNGTAIGVAYNGTGTTSPSTNHIMLGNGASGFKTVNGLGNSGEFLTSNGAGAAPSWSSASVNQTLAYSWTGPHLFSGGASSTGTTTISASSLTTNPFVINSLAYKWPSVRGASSTVLMEDGSGNLTWNPPGYTLLGSFDASGSTAGATTTFSTLGLQNLRVTFYFTSISPASDIRVTFNGDYGSNYGYYQTETAGPVQSHASAFIYVTQNSTTSPGRMTFDISNPASARKNMTFNGSYGSNSGTNAPILVNGAAVWNNTAAQITTVNFNCAGGCSFGAGTQMRVYGY